MRCMVAHLSSPSDGLIEFATDTRLRNAHSFSLTPIKLRLHGAAHREALRTHLCSNCGK